MKDITRSVWQGEYQRYRHTILSWGILHSQGTQKRVYTLRRGHRRDIGHRIHWTLRRRWCTHLYNVDSKNRVSPATRRNQVRHQSCMHLYNMDSGNRVSPNTHWNRVRRRWCTHFYNVDSGDRIPPATRRNQVRCRWRTHPGYKERKKTFMYTEEDL